MCSFSTFSAYIWTTNHPFPSLAYSTDPRDPPSQPTPQHLCLQPFIHIPALTTLVPSTGSMSTAPHPPIPITAPHRMRHRYLSPCSRHFFPFPSIFVAKATSLCAMKFLGICTFAHVYKPRFLSCPRFLPIEELGSTVPSVYFYLILRLFPSTRCWHVHKIDFRLCNGNVEPAIFGN